MICKNCNKEFFENDGKCPFCGSEVADEKSKSSADLEGNDVKKDKKKTLKTILIVVISLIAVAGIAFGAVALVKHFKGKDQAALPKGDIMAGDVEITYEEIQYYYFAAYNSLVETAIATDRQYGTGFFAEKQSFDYTKSPAEQSFPKELLPEGETKTYNTWDDYIFETVIESLKFLYAMEAEATKAGVKLTKEEKTTALAELEEMKTTAEARGISLEEYIEDNYGAGIKEADVEKWMLRDALARKYAQQKMDELIEAVTDDEIDSELEKNRNDYACADLRVYAFGVDTTGKSNGKSESEKDAEEFLSDIITEDDFISKVQKIDEELSTAEYADAATNFYQAQYAALEKAFGKDDAEWLMDKTRKTGDKKVCAYKENDEIVVYYAFYIVKPSYIDKAMWEDEIRNMLGNKAYEKYEDGLRNAEEYAIVKSDKAEKGLSDLRKKIADDIKNRLEPDTDATHSFVKFTMENGGSFTVELYPEYAPITVENFLDLVESGFYDGLTFHRVVEGFVAQGGDPSGDGTGGSDHNIYGEFSENGFVQNTLSHDRGVISMARSSYDPNSASSQFFICYNGNNKAALDGKYAAFGKVVEGMEVVDGFLEIEMLPSPAGENSVPSEPIVIAKAEVISFIPD